MNKSKKEGLLGRSIEFGEDAKRSRIRIGISQQRLAELCGVSRPTVSRIENGRGKITPESVEVADFLGIDIGEYI